MPLPLSVAKALSTLLGQCAEHRLTFIGGFYEVGQRPLLEALDDPDRRQPLNVDIPPDAKLEDLDIRCLIFQSFIFGGTNIGPMTSERASSLLSHLQSVAFSDEATRLSVSGKTDDEIQSFLTGSQGDS